MLKFESENIIVALDSLPRRASTAFAACCAQRLAGPFYLATTFEKGESSLINEALDVLWKYSGGAEVQLSPTLQALSLQLSDEDDESSYAQIVASDAIAVALYAARTQDGSAPQEAAWAAQRVYEAVDQLLIRQLDPRILTDEVEARILKSEIVQQELTRQNRDLTLLKNKYLEDSGVVNTLRELTSGEAALPLKALEHLFNNAN